MFSMADLHQESFIAAYFQEFACGFGSTGGPEVEDHDDVLSGDHYVFTNV
jgi:hypothetical protein